MGFVIGMDEAGYGPNLGPLVVCATCWEVPGDPREFDLWDALQDVVTQSARDEPSKLHIADSKEVYTPARGRRALETAVMVAARSLWPAVCDWYTFRQNIDADSWAEDRAADWYRGFNPRLPTTSEEPTVQSQLERFAAACEQHQVRLKYVQCSVVEPGRFNSALQSCESKGVLLSMTSLQLLRRLWEPNGRQPTLVICDKHGGRNRYDHLISNVADGQMIFRIEEGREVSCYRVGETELRFRMRAEQFLPVAMASLVAKYTRELSMDALNEFWQTGLPDLKPTRGYPVDARRFLTDIQPEIERRGVALSQLWREK